MESQHIVVRGAREHNLKNIQLELPRNKLIVFTGVSGSGKSSLAFDTLYAEGQRRYVESLSSYARQFLGQLPKPDVDFIGGLSPTICIQQKSAARNPRSTVGTVTEIADFLRVLYARIGLGHCMKCGKPITAQGREQMIERIVALPEGTRFLVLAPLVRGQKGEFKDFFAEWQKKGFVRARVDGAIIRMADDLKLDRKIKHSIEIVIDRLVASGKNRSRIAEAVEQALNLAEGACIVSIEKERVKEGGKEAETEYEDMLLSSHYACTTCGISYEPPSPQLFSFNSPQGMCLSCDGLGTRFAFDPDLLIPDPSLSFDKGCFPIIGKMTSMGKWRKHIYVGVFKTLGIDIKKPWEKLSKEHQDLILTGSGKTHITYEWPMRGGKIYKHGGEWEGVIPQLMAGFKKVAAGPRRMQLEKYMRVQKCGACNGQRLNAQARAVQVAKKTLVEVGSTPIGELSEWFGEIEKKLDPVQKIIAVDLLKEIRGRLTFLLNVGLDYLNLDRSAPSLSGGEAQRIRLAGQIGSGLVGVLYILDEPSIGLHPRDNERLLGSLEKLRDMGNTVLVVEHDEDTMRRCDFLVDFGPGPGVRGGEIVSAGSPDYVMADAKSQTGQFLSGKMQIEIPKERKKPGERVLAIRKARHNNLRNVDVDIPLGTFVVVTGVSGSGKSSLVNEVLLEGLKELGRGRKDEETEESEEAEEQGRVVGSRCDSIEGSEQIDKVIDIDQKPIGRTPRSNPGTYIKLFDEIRSLFAQMNDAKVRGYLPGRFSFNKPGGRCEACEGNGANKLEMDFLADVWVTCPVCDGKRFNRETLQVKYRGKSITDVLEMDVQDALNHFENVPKVRAMLQTLHDVGLDYIKIGQASPTLSGGEAQRIKLAKELCRRGTGKTLYILDEPTTGLHFEDIRKLLEVLHGFKEAGNTVLVIEHNLDVIKTADHVIDLGPEGGKGGGEIVAFGTPEKVAGVARSHTGQALKPFFQKRKVVEKKKANVFAKTERITHITVEGARQHNLKDVSVRIPREEMTVCCGPSGSGKSTLALDTIYAEGQRRYVESLSSYARQFLGQVQKPKVERVDGLSPAISIEQKTTSKSPRSTVGTITEIQDYLRVLYARLGEPHCPRCQIPIGTQSADQIVERVMNLPEGSKVYLLAPLEPHGQETYDAVFDDVRRAGFARVRVNGKTYPVDAPPEIDHKRKHKVEAVIDRNVVRAGNRSRIAEGIETALSLGKGIMLIAHVDDAVDEPKWKTERFSQHLACGKCGRSYDRLSPHNFSFNSALGWCPSCEGLGTQKGANTSNVIRNPALSIRGGAVAAFPILTEDSPFLPFAEAICGQLGINMDDPLQSFGPAAQRQLLYGTGAEWIDLPKGHSPAKFQYKGIIPAMDEAARVSFVYRQRLTSLVDEVPCGTCNGSRLRADAAAVRFQERTLGDLGDLPIEDSLDLFKTLKWTKRESQIAGELRREIQNRLQFLADVGLEYLSLSRPGPTLSGGEAQRIRLASQIGSGLTGVLYVLDEPTIGLHPRDNTRLLQALERLRDLGNTLLLVEHDRDVIAAADYLLDFGPGAGDHGGEITAEGKPNAVAKNSKSLTGAYLTGTKSIAVPMNRRLGGSGQWAVGSGEKSTSLAGVSGKRKKPAAKHSPLPLPPSKQLVVKGARQNNLKNIDLEIPLGAFVAITGVSGSGKSTLVNEVIYNTLARKLNRAQTPAAAVDGIEGLDQIDKIINVDQDPIGNSPSSNPATYTGVFDLIRQLYSQMPEAKVRGYNARRFSFNQPGGRCEDCEGNGQKRIEMHFLPDVWIECETCKGARYNPETLAVKYKDKSIADVLAMRVGEALELFAHIPKIRTILQTLADVGLDYAALGQPAPTLSGGEAQRVKLASELARPNTGRTLYLLDEPTTGLHFDDIRKLLDVLHRLVDLGNTVLVVEHNLDVIKTADWVIDLGPEAGAEGGRVVAAGTPEEVVEIAAADKKAGRPFSQTAVFIDRVLKAGPLEERPRFDPKAKLEAEKRADEVDLDKVGKDTRMPWQVDGRMWHTQGRVTTAGKPAKWEGKILDFVEEKISALGTFSPTDWSERTVVEIAGKPKSLGWFFHAHTGMEWLVRLVFRVSRNAFKEPDLIAKLGIKPLDQTKDLKLEYYSNEQRVRVENRKGPWQEVWMLVHNLDEIDTPAFQAFLKQAATSFQKNIGVMQTSVEDVMPWKVDGKKWHLGEKGFPAGRKIQWDRAALPHIIRLFESIDPKVQFDWDVRDAFSVRMEGGSRAWARVRTKDHEALTVRFWTKPGMLNLGMFEGVGQEAQVERDRADGREVYIVQIKQPAQAPADKLQPLMRKMAESSKAEAV